MGTFRVKASIDNIGDRHRSASVDQMLVDTGSDYTWIPRELLERIGCAREKNDIPFVMANGQQITRSVGFVVIHVDNFLTVDEVVFGEPGDQSLLGARTLEGFNARVEPKNKKLVAAGPVVAAGNSRVGL